jgi:hypothetical protein
MHTPTTLALEVRQVLGIAHKLISIQLIKNIEQALRLALVSSAKITFHPFLLPYIQNVDV